MVDIEIFKEFGTGVPGRDVEVVGDVVLPGRLLSLLVLMLAAVLASGLLPVTLRIRLFVLFFRLLGEELLLDEVLEQHAIELARLTLRLAFSLVLHNSRQLPKDFLLQS